MIGKSIVQITTTTSTVNFGSSRVEVDVADHWRDGRQMGTEAALSQRQHGRPK